jgi:putative hemolysin
MVLDSDRVWKIVILIICLVLSALFSASETALMSLSKIRVKQMIENREKGANRINKLLSDPSRLLSAILIGNNVVNIGASSLMTSLAIDAFGNTGVGVATGIMTLLILVFGEITPKSLAAKNSEKISVRLSGFIEFVTNLLTPISFVLNIITDFLVKLLGGEVDKKKPLDSNSKIPEFTTLRLIPIRDAISRSGGSLSPGLSSPEIIFASISLTNSSFKLSDLSLL